MNKHVESSGVHVLVTGANGFVGRSLCKQLLALGYTVTAVVRNSSSIDRLNSPRYRVVVIRSIEDETDWIPHLRGVNVVVHLAARVHVPNRSIDELEVYRQVNTLGTQKLAESAALSGVHRFVLISSIKVNGETSSGRPFNEESAPMPADAYGISKWEAERCVLSCAQNSSTMDAVIIRPPLVYGPGVKANFETMMDWLYRRIPLPLGAVHNLRSLVSLDNLVDFIITCIEHQAASNQTFLVSDGEDISTTQLLLRTGHALGRPGLLLPVPAFILTAGARLLGKEHLAQRLLGSLRIDSGKASRVLGWKPPRTVDEGLRQTAEAFIRSRRPQK